MSVHLHLIEHRLLGSVASVVLICVSLAWPAALTQEIDEGEFSRRVLGYKLQLLKSQFEQTEMRLLTEGAAASIAKNWSALRARLSAWKQNFGGRDITLICSMSGS